jgi:hypothetical protein
MTIRIIEQKSIPKKAMVYEIEYRLSPSYGDLNERYSTEKVLVLGVTGCVTLVQGKVSSFLTNAVRAYSE